MIGPGVAALVAAVAVTLAARVVEAEGDGDPAALVAEGEDLARRGEYSRAIARFKQAEGIEPHAANGCRIGLAYLRRELWPQAEIFLAQCRQRSSAADPAPDWLPEAEKELASKLAEVDVAAVDIRVTPAAAPALISLSSFAPDEQFAPRTIHLPPGSYSLTVSAPGYRGAQATVTVADRSAQTVAVALEPEAARPAHSQPLEPRPPEADPPPSSRSTWILVGAAGLAAVGGGFHVLAVRERRELADARERNDPAQYDDHETRFDVFRAVTIGCYAGAAIAAGVGVWLRVGDRRDRAVAVRPSVEPGRALLVLEWQR